MLYTVNCKCGNVELSLNDKPIVHAYCHCKDCRDLLDIPYHSVTAWKKGNVSILKGTNDISIYQHPDLSMQKHFCNNCGEGLFNTDGMNWRVVSQLLISKCNNNELPEEL